jgi:hypothetical protein
MKFVIYALVLANIVMAGWLYRHGDDYRDLPPAVVPNPSDSEPLRLLNERTTRDVRPRLPPLTDELSVHPPAQTQLPASDLMPPAQPPEPVMGTAERAVPESKQDISMAGGTQKPEERVPEPVSPPQRICQTVGPFADRMAVDTFVATLSTLGPGPKTAVREVQVEQPSGYWVYLPAMPREDAQRIVADFASKGVKDYFLGRQNFISLGVFSDKPSAEKRVQEIAALGYPSRLEPRFLMHQVYWADLEELDNRQLSADQWGTLMAEQTGIRRQPLTCE